MNVPADNVQFEQLLEYLRRSRGFDFTGYKRTSLMRRVDKRMHAVGEQRTPIISTTSRSTPRSSAALFDTILINVTAFFRDPSAWEAIATRSSRGSSTASDRATRSGSGAPAAPRARRRTPWPWSWRRPWGSTRSATG